MKGLPIEDVKINGQWFKQRASEAKCEMICESCDNNHFAPLLDNWTCNCRLSVIIQKVNGKIVSRRINNKLK